MYLTIQVGGTLYRVYGPHVYAQAPKNNKYLFFDGTYWQPTDILIKKISCQTLENSV